MNPQTHVTLNSQRYKLARKNLVPTGSREWSVTLRPSQRGDPGDLLHADWQISGPQFHSAEEVGDDGVGFLGTDYTHGADTRWRGRLTLGPKMNFVTLNTLDVTYTNSKVDETTANADLDFHADASPIADVVEAVETVDGAGTTYAYIARGQFVTKVDLEDMTVKETRSFPGPVKSLLKTRHPNGRIELSVGMATQPYWVMTGVGTPPNPDNWTVNSASAVIKIFGQGTDRIAGLYERTAAGNVLSGNTTMANPNWQTVATINDDFDFTGFALDGSSWVLMTDNGPYVLDPDEGQFYPLVPEIDRNSRNRVIGTWYPLGVLFSHRFGMRYFRDGFGLSMGPEVFATNRSGVHGQVTAFAGSELWLYLAFADDVVASGSYFMAMRPESDQRHPLGYAPYLMNYTGSLGILAPPALDSTTFCHAMKYIGTVNGLRSRPTLLLGNDDDLTWTTIGATQDETADTSYRFTEYGEWFGTELRRYSHLVKDMEAVEVETSDCTASRSATLSCRVTSTAGVQTTVTLNGALTGVNDAITSDGRQRRLWVNDSNVPLTTASGIRLRPRVELSTNVATDSPTLEGVLRIYYRVRPIMTREILAFFVLDGSTPGKVATEKLTDLQNLVDQSGPVLLSPDAFGDALYVKVKKVDVLEMQDKGRGQEQTPTPVQVARVEMVEWATVSGS